MLLPYLRAVRGLVKNFLKNKLQFLSFCIALALALTFFYSIIAGHVLFSVTGGFYLIMVLIYGDFYFRPESVHPKVKARKAKKG